MELITLIILIFIIVCYFLYIFGSNARTEKLLKKYSKVENSAGLTGAEFINGAYEVMGYGDCEVQYSDEKNIDCYIPKYKLIVLHKDFCFKPTLSALGVAAHEFGHCVQHKEKRFVFVLTNFFRFFSKLTKILCLPIFVVGIYYIFKYQFNTAQVLFISSVACLLLSCGFNLLTIPCEFNASAIGIDFLIKYKLIKPSEERNIRKILKAAGNTYVASFYRSIGLKMPKHKQKK